MKKSRIWIKRLLLTTAILYVSYLVLSGLAMPAIVKWIAPRKTAEATHGSLQITSFRFNPFTLVLKIEGLSLADAKNKELAGVDKIRVNLQLSSLFKRRLRLKEVTVAGPRASVIRDQDGKINWAALAKTQPETETKEEEETKEEGATTLPPIDIAILAVEDGAIEIHDNSLKDGFTRNIRNMSFKVSDFSTQPDSQNPTRFFLKTDRGTEVLWEGDLKFDPLSSAGKLTVKNLQPATYSPYYSKLCKAQVESCRVDLDVSYEFDPAAKTPVIKLANTRLAVSDIAMQAPKEENPFASMKSIELAGLNVDLVSGVADLNSLVIDGGTLLARRDRDQVINLLNNFLPPTTTADTPAPTEDEKKEKEEEKTSEPAPPSASPAPASGNRPRDILYAIQETSNRLSRLSELNWQAKLERFALLNQHVEWLDQVPKTPVGINIEKLDLELTSLSNTPGDNALLTANVSLSGGGEVKIDGNLTPMEGGVELTIEMNHIDLSQVAPYVRDLNDVGIDSALLSSKITASGKLSKTDELPDVKIKADLTLAKLSLSHGLYAERSTFAKWEELSVKNVTMDSLDGGVSIASVTLQKPHIELDIDEEGKLSIAKLEPPKKDEDEEEPEKDEKEKEFPLSIASINIEDGSLTFRDAAYGPGFTRTIDKLDLQLTGFALPTGNPMGGNLKGQGDDGMQLSGLFEMTQREKSKKMNVSLTGNGINLPALSPYTIRYVAYPLSSGTFNIKQSYDINDKHLVGDIDIGIVNIDLGKKQKSPDAVKLPLKLAIALLRDREGNIDLPEIHIEGDLDDPKFSVSRVVWYALKNIIIKSATAPFSLLADVIGSDLDLELANCIPGQAVLLGADQKVLEDLAKALTKRPSLSLVIHPDFNQEKELTALKQILFEKELEKLEETLSSIDKKLEDIVPKKDKSTDSLLAIGKTLKSIIPVKSKTVDAILQDDQPGQTLRSRIVAVYYRKEFGDEKKDPDTPAPTLEEQEKRLLEKIKVPDSVWEELGKKRAETIRLLLTGTYGVDPKRIIIAERLQDKEKEATCGVRFSVK